jgi:glycosyltransferase involved in cell wall biosynthesis
MATRLQVTCLVKRWPHHTASGGYDRLAAAVSANVVERHRVIGLPGKIAQKIWVRQTGTHRYLLDYQFGDLLAELRILSAALVHRDWDVLHALYGDEQLDLLLRYRAWLRGPLVASFHLPSRRVAHRFEIIQPDAGEKIDAAIVLASDQIASFERWIGAGKVVYVPHGIDTFRFCPGERTMQRSRLRLISVGEHMRDWNVIHRVVDECYYHSLPVDFDIVTTRQSRAHFTGCSNVTLHSEIPESELIALYQEADALIIPMIDATANNSVLEALACGTPVISTRVGGLPDYVTEKCGWLFAPGEIDGILDLIKGMSADPSLAESRRHEARWQALKFDWQEIASRLFVIYSAVASGRSPMAAVTEFDSAVGARTLSKTENGARLVP